MSKEEFPKWKGVPFRAPPEREISLEWNPWGLLDMLMDISKERGALLGEGIELSPELAMPDLFDTINKMLNIRVLEIPKNVLYDES